MQNFEEQAKAFAERMDAEIAEDRLSFPVSMELSMRIKRLADDPSTRLDQIAAVVQAEPLLSARVLRAANSVALNPSGGRIDSVRDAVRRVGLSTLRGLALALASEQLAGDHRSPNMRMVAYGLWLRSVDVAAWCYALARQTRAASPDAALLAGMLTHIGQLFLLARASDYPAMEANIDLFGIFADTHHHRVGVAVLKALEMPANILDSLEIDQAYDGEWPPRDLGHVVRLASLVSELPNPFDGLVGRMPVRGPAAAAQFGVDPAALGALLEASHEERQHILAAVRG
jgi:HD-like signal output (HDOD) protein